MTKLLDEEHTKRFPRNWCKNTKNYNWCIVPFLQRPALFHHNPEQVDRQSVMVKWHQKRDNIRHFIFRTEHSRNKRGMWIHAPACRAFMTCIACLSIPLDTVESIDTGWTLRIRLLDYCNFMNKILPENLSFLWEILLTDEPTFTLDGIV